MDPRIVALHISSASTFSRAVSAAAACLVIAGGLATFCGWAFDVHRLTDWFGTGLTMKANPAVAAVSAGLSLLIIVMRAGGRVSRSLAMFTSVLGAATLLQHIADIDLGIDTLLFDEPPGLLGTASPGRMGPPAASSFLFIGVALVFLPTARRERIAVALALVVLGIATLSLVGYWYGAQVMYTVPRLTGISLQMAMLLATLAIGVLAAARNAGPMKLLLQDDDARALALRLFPAAVMVPLATGWLRMQGQRLGYYDSPFGTAMRTVIEIGLLAALTWWSVKAIRSRDLQRQRAEQERDKSERRFRSVLDASAVPFNVLAPVYDSTGAIVDFEWNYLNAAAAASLRRNAHDLVGRRVHETLPGSWDEPGLFQRYVSVIENRRVEEFELHSSANGVDGWFQVIASPFDRYVAVWFADVTERKRQELELRSADRRKDEFLATLAHELRNPLAPIRQASLLTRKPGLSDAQRQWCNEVIERQVQHMSLLLEDLLDVSRITRGTLQLRRQITTIQSVVQSAVETARPLIDSKKHALHVDVENESLLVDIDPLRMAQILANLLNNAAKYTDAGGTIQLTVRTDGDTLILRVTDTGIGIAPESLPEIFRMFAQVRSAQERSEGGLGIGLALTRGLVELHGGRIEVHSAGIGAGASFTVSVPKAVVGADSHVHDAGAIPERISTHKILVADDNKDAAESLAKLLMLDGHDVRIASDGAAAIELAEAFRPDIALLDLGMPRMTGHEVARHIRSTPGCAHTRLIAITGWGQKSDRERSAASGFDHHLTKPVEYMELSALLR